MGHGGHGVGVAHGRGNGLATAIGRAIGLVTAALGRSNTQGAHSRGNGQGMANGRGNGAAHGRGFGLGHASVGNPGHNALSGRSSHSQNTSNRGGTPNGRSFSNHSNAGHSLAQDHAANNTKADQGVQANDRGPGKAKGFVDSLPANQELQADRSVTLNPETIPSDVDNTVALGLQPSPELESDLGKALSPHTRDSDHDVLTTVQADPELLGASGGMNRDAVHSDLDKIAPETLIPGLELQADNGRALNPATIHLELDDTVTRGLEPILALNLASLHTIVLDMDDTPAAMFPYREEFDDIRAKTLPLTAPELEDDDATGWKLAPFYSVALAFLVAIFFSRQGILREFQRDTFRQPPNPSLTAYKKNRKTS